MSITIDSPRSIEELRRMSDDDIRYLAQRDRISPPLVKKYGSDKIRELLEGESQMAAPPLAPPASNDVTDTNDLTTWSNSRLRGEIVTLAERLGEEPDLDGKKSRLISTLEGLQAQARDEAAAEAEAGEDDEDTSEDEGGE